MIKTGSDKEIFEIISSLDLEPILFSLVEKKDGPNWSLDKAKNIEKWYRRFLFLTCKHPTLTIVPTKEIDEFWHHHILDTRNYVSDCELIYGEYIHHFPYLGSRGKDDEIKLEASFLDTLALFEKYFNCMPLDAYSSKFSAMCGRGVITSIEQEEEMAHKSELRPRLSH